MIVFALLELQSWFRRLRAPAALMPLGGAFTGFFGGLTGQQGALRSIFLLRAGLSAQGFIATGVMIAVAVDLSRLAAYTASFAAAGEALAARDMRLIAVGTLAAMAGAYWASRRVDKVTTEAVRPPWRRRCC